MANSKIVIRYIEFISKTRKPSKVEFVPGVNLIYGASNTGKSFLLKTLDFMFGGSDPLPDIEERIGYEYVLLGFSLTNSGDFTLCRSINGGNYSLYAGLINELPKDEKPIILTVGNPPKGLKSLSQWFLEEIGFAGKRLAAKVTGATENISIRNFSAFFLVNETTIQSEKSVIEGDLGPLKTTKERSFFRLLLTGSDDSSIIQVPDRKTYSTLKKAKIDILNELLEPILQRLEKEYPDQRDLTNQFQRLTNTLSNINEKYLENEKCLSEEVKSRISIESELKEISERISEAEQHQEKFYKLDEIYNSDIARLKAIEEAGQILTLSMDRNCDLCGAPPEAQIFKKGLEDIEKSRIAANAEIQKIIKLKEELQYAITDIHNQRDIMDSKKRELESQFDITRKSIADKTRDLDAIRKNLLESMEIRDKIKEGMRLVDQKVQLERRLAEISNAKYSKDGRPSLKTPDILIHELCSQITEVLKAWDFPGECKVSFDPVEFDIIIDGKLRTNNGKGVRAITHSAFKIALLLLCEKKALPYPGFLILDSPLVTYRDPIKNKKHGDLSKDEEELKKTKLKENFFIYLAKVKESGQFIVLENVDPPMNISDYAHVEVFYGNPEAGRAGLFID